MSESRKKKMIEACHVKKAANGGYVVSNHYDNRGSGESWQPSDDHVYENLEGAKGHLDKAFGGKKPKDGG